MKKIFKLILLAFLLLAPTVNYAQKSLKFGHVNSQEIIQTMPEKDSVVNKLEKFRKELSDTYDGLQTEFQAKYQKFQEDEKTLNDLVRKTRQEELQQMQQRIQQFQESANQQIPQKQSELMQPLIEKLKNAITEVGKEGGFIYIFDIGGNTNVLFYSAESQDVTTLIKQKLGLKK
jgi:outer membrane protein